ncbi:MAG: methyltransferase domain-containing protein [Acidobacteria bacterium]|nr:methyltransferase domain-containing protein [Acidobacteriota bacterium]
MLNPLGRGDNPHALVVGMSGVKMGERVLFVGCGHGERLAAIAAKSGLSGRALAILPDQASADAMARGAAHEGVLVEIEQAPPTRLPVEDGAFDVAIVDDTSGVLGTLRAEDRVAAIRELLRVLRGGGRVLVMGASPRGGLGALFARSEGGPPFASSGEANRALQADGFASVRTLARRQGLVFVEGLKSRTR